MYFQSAKLCHEIHARHLKIFCRFVTYNYVHPQTVTVQFTWNCYCSIHLKKKKFSAGCVLMLVHLRMLTNNHCSGSDLSKNDLKYTSASCFSINPLHVHYLENDLSGSDRIFYEPYSTFKTDLIRLLRISRLAPLTLLLRCVAHELCT